MRRRESRIRERRRWRMGRGQREGEGERREMIKKYTHRNIFRELLIRE